MSDGQPSAVEELVRQTAPQPIASGTRFVLLGAALATVVCVLIALLSFPLWQPTSPTSDSLAGDNAGNPDSETNDGEAVRPAIARVMRSLNVQWGDGHKEFSLGDPVNREWLHLSSGIVQLEFSSGAAVTLEGPAQLRVDSETECFVRQGKVVVLGPPDFPEFTVTSPGTRVVDIGTEFAVVVDDSGITDVHVIDGEVDVSLTKSQRRSDRPQRLVEAQAASLDPSAQKIHSVPFDGDSFELLRPANLARNQPLRIQFDCGVLSGIYRGVDSPGHATGDFYQHETFWNPIVGDHAGKLVTADGTLFPGDLEIDSGQATRISHDQIDWDEPPALRGSNGNSRGVFRTALGEDAIRGRSRVGLRIGGLPQGKYRVYVIGRSSVVHPTWGNFLIDKAYNCWIGVDQDLRRHPIRPLEDESALEWSAGQTHSVGEVTITESNEFLTLIVHKDRKESPVPEGGGAPILGVQIMQLSE